MAYLRGLPIIEQANHSKSLSNSDRGLTVRRISWFVCLLKIGSKIKIPQDSNAQRWHREDRYLHEPMPLCIWIWFQALMSMIFQPWLHKFLLIFYDILIYNKSLEEHMDHLHLIHKFLEENQLHANSRKSFFLQSQHVYLSYWI